jgi:hypothetical protein
MKDPVTPVPPTTTDVIALIILKKQNWSPFMFGDCEVEICEELE